MKLRNMSAHVTEEKNITIELASGEFLNLENALVLHSYSSRVAVYCNMRVYLLPRYDYSVWVFTIRKRNTPLARVSWREEKCAYTKIS